MMKGIALIAILSMPSLPAHADTWLCIAEKVAFLRSKDGQIVGGGYEPYDQKYLVSEAGFRYFDIDDYRLDECTFYDGKPTWCESSTDLWSGEFMMDSHNLFTLIGLNLVDRERVQHFIAKGK